MSRRKPRLVEKPWQPDREKWKKLLAKKDVVKRDILEPKGGWQLWDWKTPEDRSQDENARPC